MNRSRTSTTRARTSDELVEAAIVHAMCESTVRVNCAVRAAAQLLLKKSRETEIPPHGRLKWWQRTKTIRRKKGERKCFLVDVYSRALKDLYMSTNVKTNVD